MLHAATLRRFRTPLLALSLVVALAVGGGAGVYTYRASLEAQRHALRLEEEKDQAMRLLLLVRQSLAAQLAHLLLQQPRDMEADLRAMDALADRGRQLAAVLEPPLLATGLTPVGSALEHLMRVQRHAAEVYTSGGQAAVALALRDGTGWRLAVERIEVTLGEFVAARRAALEALETGQWREQMLGFALMAVSTLGMLGVMLMALTQAAQRRTAAERAHEEMERRGREVASLFAMGELLQSGQSAEDVRRVVLHTARLLLPELAGAFYVFNSSRDRLDLLAGWECGGVAPQLPPYLAPGECWALKRGRPHLHGFGEGLRCEHSQQAETGCLCLPMQARGELHGVLQFHARPQAAPDASRVALAHALADGVSLALANMALREKLRSLALRDELTGLYNRRFLEETQPRMLAQAERRNAPLAVLMLDLDHFKQVNDRYGHAAGDAVLRGVGQLLTMRLRRTDVACRYGGEELLVLMPDCAPRDALARAEQLCEEVRRLDDRLDQALPEVTVSIGVAVWPDHGGRIEDVVAAADAALYAAKRAGRNRAIMAGEAPPTAAIAGTEIAAIASASMALSID